MSEALLPSVQTEDHPRTGFAAQPCTKRGWEMRTTDTGCSWCFYPTELWAKRLSKGPTAPGPFYSYTLTARRDLWQPLFPLWMQESLIDQRSVKRVHLFVTFQDFKCWFFEVGKSKTPSGNASERKKTCFCMINPFSTIVRWINGSFAQPVTPKQTLMMPHMHFYSFQLKYFESRISIITPGSCDAVWLLNNSPQFGCYNPLILLF